MSKEESFFNLKYMGYCMAHLPPEEPGVKIDYNDFIRYAKFHLSLDKGLLMEDPIWDRYTEEAILVEFFASTFVKNEKERERFETILAGSSPDINNWFDNMIKKNQVELSAKSAEHEDQVKFVPETLGE